MPEITKEQAIELGKSEFWEKMTQEEIAEFQINTDALCMPFGVFHQAMEIALGRPVWTHEFGINVDGLRAELRGDKLPRTLQKIMDLIPPEKRIIVIVHSEEAT